jgi:UDP-glucose 4-epimerase
VRVAVTGGTGFLGAHTVKALVDDGHEVRLLLHPSDSLDAVAAVGVDTALVEVVPGDVCDPAAVDALLGGSDAVLHAAGVVGVDERQAALMERVNVGGTRVVLGQAVALGLDPIVHVASYIALFPPPSGVITPDSPTAVGRSAYGRTKAAADRIAREHQAAGSPVVITYPSSVAGPPAGSRRGITADGLAPLLRLGVSVTFDGAMTMVDVRDVAAVHAALMEQGRGPRRYVCGGHMVRFDDALDAVERVTGRRLRRVRVSGRAIRGIGRVSDLLARWLPMTPSFSYEAAWLLTAMCPTDDSRTHSELGVHWRPVEDTLAASIDGLRAAR